MAVADASRKVDYDGRGNLSEKGLITFCEYFFEVAEDQILFMNELLQLEKLRERIMGYVNLRSQNMIPDEEPLREEARYVLAEIMIRGEVPRGEMKRISGLGERMARELTSQLNLKEKNWLFQIAIGVLFVSIFPQKWWDITFRSYTRRGRYREKFHSENLRQSQ